MGCIIYALMGTNELVLDKLNLHTLESKYLVLGIPIQFVTKVVRQMQILIAPLINNSDIAEILDGYFEDVITKLDNQDRSTLLKKQHQGLARLRQKWLAEDADEQTKTWNYLRDALNPDSLSYSPVTIGKRIVFLDTGVLGAVTNPNAKQSSNSACLEWLVLLPSRGYEVAIPEIADYELRRELLRVKKSKGIQQL